MTLLWCCAATMLIFYKQHIEVFLVCVSMFLVDFIAVQLFVIYSCVFVIVN